MWDRKKGAEGAAGCGMVDRRGGAGAENCSGGRRLGAYWSGAVLIK